MSATCFQFHFSWRLWSRVPSPPRYTKLHQNSFPGERGVRGVHESAEKKSLPARVRKNTFCRSQAAPKEYVLSHLVVHQTRPSVP